MWELISAGGWVMAPILVCSILAVAIVTERLWLLRPARIAPSGLVPTLWEAFAGRRVDEVELRRLQGDSPLGEVLASVLMQYAADPLAMRERAEEAGQQAVYSLSRYLNTLGTIASITPLLGLLGTVFGMIDVFAAIDAGRTAEARALAGGIGQALITTGAGLTIAIPSVIAHRHLRGQVEMLTRDLERETSKLIALLERNGPAKNIKMQ